MGRKRCWINLMLILVLISLVIRPALACKLPVFRYALERWNVDRYRMVALVDDVTDPAVGEALTLLRSLDADEGNLEIEIIELAELSEAQWWQLEGMEGEVANRLQVHFPNGKGETSLGWSGALTPDNVRSWIDSPLRQALVEDLLSGVSAVWIQVDGPDEVVNVRVAEQLRETLQQASQEILIPDGVIARDDAVEYLREHPEASMDDVLRCDVPLKVEFRSRRLARHDARESATLAMIDALRGQTDRPLLVPVFGRGRMLDAIPCEQIDDQIVRQACRYMVSECSCTVKSLNPGSDLLLRVNWQQSLGGDPLVFDPVIGESPVLVDIPQGRSEDNWGRSEDQSAQVPSPLSANKAIPLAGSPVGRAMGVGALAFIAAGFVSIWSRKRRNVS